MRDSPLYLPDENPAATQVPVGSHCRALIICTLLMGVATFHSITIPSLTLVSNVFRVLSLVPAEVFWDYLRVVKTGKSVLDLYDVMMTSWTGGNKNDYKARHHHFSEIRLVEPDFTPSS